jgi:hypothetical protein
MHMRTVFISLLGVAVALSVALVVQVLVAQMGERGDFGERVATVVNRAFGIDPARSVAADAAPPDGRGSETTGSTAALESLRISDLTVGDLQKLLSEADQRGASEFWTDVRLNGLFLFLGLLAPIMMARGRR